MILDIVISASAVALFASMLALLELGTRMERRRLAREPGDARTGTTPAEGSVFALLGLLIAFTFSGAAERFDQRRKLIVAETNAVGTAWLRLDLLPAAARERLQQGFREYLDARLAVYRVLLDPAALRVEQDRATALQDELWTVANQACTGEAQGVALLVLPALNEMFDVSTERGAALRMHVPGVILGLLFLLALGCALLAGFAMAASSGRNWTQRIAFALVITATVYVILDLEFPRRGLIRVDAADQLLVDLRASMG